MSEESVRPLITFLLICYNQEKYIKEALEGAFSQTYSPLEIVISDDASDDDTWRIVEEEVAKYQGPHVIKLNRNKENKGIGGNVNAAMEMAEGELIVAAAGDDVSFSKRVKRIYEFWLSGGKEFISIFSAAEQMDEKGRKCGEYHSKVTVISDPAEFKKAHISILGASHAWHRQVFDTFGPFIDGVYSEDVIIPFRSLLLGKLAYLDEILVKHRVSVGFSSKSISLDTLMKYRLSVVQNEIDIDTYPNKYISAKHEVKKALCDYGVMINICRGNYYKAIVDGVKCGISLSRIIRKFLIYLVNRNYLFKEMNKIKVRIKSLFS